MSRDDLAERLAREVARAGRRPQALRALLLDLDGTLAPIAPTPGDAVVPPETLRALRGLLRRGWSVAIVTGRPIRDARAMVPLRGARFFGSHGAEGSWEGRSGRPGRKRPTAVKSLTRRAERLARGVPGAYVEGKPHGVALHDRNVAPEALGAWRCSVRDLLAASDLEGLEVLTGRRVIEVRPWGHHKGRVVEELLERARPPRLDPSLLAVGDDRTDEDMFRAILGKGLPVRVGRPGKVSLAMRRLPSPAAVRRFLERLVSAQARSS